jgi:uncharacterized protein YjbI with pentapeptide repeats
MNRSHRFHYLTLAIVLSLTTLASAHIYEWELRLRYKQQSTIICPDGYNVEAIPDADLSGLDLTKAWLCDKDLTDASFENTNLTIAYLVNADLTRTNFTGANLNGADFGSATLTGANFTDTTVTGADFLNTTNHGFTADQLYSTASYKNGDLSRIRLTMNDLTDWNFANKNLTHAWFTGSSLKNANLKLANLTNANVSTSILTNANLSNANLTGTIFAYSTLTNADLTNATVAGANFGGTTSQGFTATQLYSTASYKNGDLSGISLYGNDLTSWNFAGQNLTKGGFRKSTLTNMNLSNANLTEANFSYCPLTDADLSNATVTGANFGGTTSQGFTAAQLYSTASYKNGDLSGIELYDNDLTGWNFAGQNLTKGRFFESTLTNANLSNANLTEAIFSYCPLTNSDLSNATVIGANFGGTTSQGFTAAQLYSTASYKNGDLSGIILAGNDLTGWNFAGQNLTKAAFWGPMVTNEGSLARYSGSILTDANLSNANLTEVDFTICTLINTDFTDAIVTGAKLDNITAAQLYSTASYKNGDLRGIDFSWNQIIGWDLAGQNLTGANLSYATLTGTDLSNANLTNAFIGKTDLTSTNLSRADLRGSYALSHGVSISVAVTNNMIWPDGRIEGLNLEAGETLSIRNYDQNRSGNSANMPIQIENEMALASEAVLRMIFTDAEWGSTISFDDGIAVNLDGLLDLTFADGVNPADLVGTTFDLFNWDGVSPAGGFISILDHGLVWDTGNLYTTGEVTLLAVPEPAMLSFLILGGLPLLRRRFV